MCAPASTSEPSVETETNGYLQQLAETAPASTLASQKTSLQLFNEWQSRGSDTNELDEEGIAGFVTYLQAKYSLVTVKGHVDTLANFAAYLHEDDPTLIKNRVASILENRIPSDHVENAYWEQLITRLRPSQPSEITHEAIETLLQYLHQCKSGTREHAFVEVIIETKAKPSLVRDIDQPDFDAESGSIEVGIADEHAVCTAGLVQSRTVSLSRSTVETLDEYTEYEQKTLKTENPVPLFTTTHGRVSESALRRGVKDASNSAFTLFNEQSLENENRRLVTPRDIWWYALTTGDD